VLLSYKQYLCFFNEKASIAIFEYNICADDGWSE